MINQQVSKSVLHIFIIMSYCKLRPYYHFNQNLFKIELHFVHFPNRNAKRIIKFQWLPHSTSILTPKPPITTCNSHQKIHQHIILTPKSTNSFFYLEISCKFRQKKRPAIARPRDSGVAIRFVQEILPRENRKR